jgi:hypothetical protein
VHRAPDLDIAYLAAPRPDTGDLPRLARRLLAVCDGRHTAAESCRSAGIPDSRRAAVMQKLLALGLVEPAFSTEEEAFFAAELLEDDFDEEGRRAGRDELGGGYVGLFAAELR